MCITTCRRLWALRRYLPHFAQFCSNDSRFDLVIALDGDEREYLDFCEQWGVSLVYSGEREGVGISKNRVLERFSDYDYYYFIEDDVELMDASVFEAHVHLSRASGIHHFSLFGSDPREQSGESLFAGNRVAHGGYGGAHFNFFTGEGLRAVGGWHPRFAEFRRWGHTEHSLRFVRRGLAPAPFNVASDLNRCFIWHFPPMVTTIGDIPFDENQIALPERELIDQGLLHFPVKTLSPHHHNGVGFNQASKLSRLLSGGERYPLVVGADRRECESDHHWWLANNAERWPNRLRHGVQALILWPGNPMIRHAVKARFGRMK